MECFLPVVGYIQKHAVASPDKTAVIGIDTAFTYQQLWAHITGIAALLRANGISRDKRVMVEANHTAEYVSLIYGIHLAGGVSVALEHGVPQDRVSEIAKEISPDLILLGDHPLSCLGTRLEDIPDCSGSAWELPTENMLQEILFTTGTTGKSKGVVVTHGAYASRSVRRLAALRLSDDNVWLIPSPMNHTAGLSRMNTIMVHGSTMLMMNGFTNLKLFFGSMKDYKVTSLYLPPSGIRYILTLTAKELAKYNDQLDFITASSAALPAADRARLIALLPDVRLFNEYGSSESGPVCYLEYSKEPKDASCVGKPYSGVEVYTVDENYAKMESSADHPGIIAVKSGCLFSGYLNMPELTADTLQNGVMYLTDMGYFDDGYLYLLGRRDDVISIGGLKVAPAEIEEAVLRFPDIEECVCLPCDNKMLGRVLKLCVVMKEGSEFDTEKLMRHLEKNLEAYKLPKFIEQINEIPKTYNGKIDRKKLLADQQGH